MTPAVLLLKKAKICHELHSYEHNPEAASYGQEAAEVLGLDPATVFKTLLAVIEKSETVKSETVKSETVVAVVPVVGQLDLKALAKVAGGKKATMADPVEAERITGYVVGGISPLGQRKQLRTFIDESAADLDRINISAGRRGLEVRLDPQDLVTMTNAQFAPLAAV